MSTTGGSGHPSAHPSNHSQTVEMGTSTRGAGTQRDLDGVDAHARAHAQASLVDAKDSSLLDPASKELGLPSSQQQYKSHAHAGYAKAMPASTSMLYDYESDAGARSEQHRLQQEKNANTCWGRMNRRWKASKLYELTSTGHEDACSFGCSNQGGRTCAYWPELYPAERLRASVWLRVQRFWVFYIRPWIFMLAVVLLILYFFVIMNNIATWRTNEMADRLGYLPPVGLDKNRPAAEQLPPDQIFILPDVMFEIFSPASGAAYLGWDYFVDMSLVVAIVFGLGMRLYMRDFVRLGEWAVVEVVMFGAGGILHALTVYPDPWGSNESCQQTNHRSYGSWVFTNLSTEFCGDQMYSGHTFNFIVALVMLRRSVYELIGWDSLPWTTFTHSTGSYRRLHDYMAQMVIRNSQGAAPVSTEEAVARAPCLSRDGTQNRTVLSKLPDATSLPGIDREGELREAQQPRPIGSAVPICAQLAAAEGLGVAREIQLAQLLRMPVYGHGSTEAQDKSTLHTQLQGGEGAYIAPTLPASNAQVARGSLRVKVDDMGIGAGQVPARPSLEQQQPHNNSSSSNSMVPASHALLQPQAAGVRVVQVYNGPCGHVLPPEAGNGALRDEVAAPMQLPGPSFALTGPILATHGGAHIGGHYGAAEESVNQSRLVHSRRARSDLPAPEWDDARGHGMNPFYRYRINMPVHERMVVSRAPPPYFVRAHPRAVWWVGNIIRVLLIGWTITFLIGIWKIRYHYATDVLISAFIGLLVVSNEKLIQSCVSYLYLPVDARYKDAPIYPFAIEPQLYEENISKLGVGGIF